MIIESAFYNLPELLMIMGSDRDMYEATLINSFAMGVHSALNARNIDMPTKRIHAEKPYPELNDNITPGRADLFVDLSSIYGSSFHQSYGMNQSNWIEAKYFGGLGRVKSAQGKTNNAGSILLDILRLSLLVKEARSKNRENARYLLLLFNRHPEEYLSLKRNSCVKEWIIPMLKPGRGELDINVHEQPVSCIKTISKKLYSEKTDLKLHFEYKTHLFEPLKLDARFMPWGALVRIPKFDISLGKLNLKYDELDESVWTKDKEDQQTKIAFDFYNYIKRVGK